jgi:hypothetical protein
MDEDDSYIPQISTMDINMTDYNISNVFGNEMTPNVAMYQPTQENQYMYHSYNPYSSGKLFELWYDIFCYF